VSGRHRAPAWEHADRVNAAVALLERFAPAAAARALTVERAISERQARRYVAAAAAARAPVAVPERTAAVTLRLPRSLLARARTVAAGDGTTVSALVADALRARVESGGSRRGRGGGQAG
jgi:hypothetical protein